MLRRISSKEISEWMAYYQLRAEPASPVVVDQSPAALSARLKAELFKGK